ncbi:hypothetical protein ACOMHN_066129 [Nucella lapillus]
MVWQRTLENLAPFSYEEAKDNASHTTRGNSSGGATLPPGVSHSVVKSHGICMTPDTPLSGILTGFACILKKQWTMKCPPPCTRCGQPIMDEFILRVQGMLWHANCLRCCACDCHVSQTCFVRGTQVLCQVDFFRLCGAACSGCGGVTTASEPVRMAQDHVYHLKCFTCVVCAGLLSTGDEFYLRHDGKLICKPDYEGTARQDRPLQAPAETPQASSRQELCQGPQPHPGTTTTTTSTHLNITFTPQETEILRRVYTACPKPSHDMLQRISGQHGLDVRRVRMWFHVHRKESEERRRGQEGAGYGPPEGVERATAPMGGYPLPIVNEVSPMSSGRLPASASRSDVMGDLPFLMTSSCRQAVGPWPLSDDVLRPDFVPPNVDLDPGDIQNGEVCSSRRGLPPSPASPDSTTRGRFAFMSASGKGGNVCPQERISSAAQPGGAGDVSLSSWLDS